MRKHLVALLSMLGLAGSAMPAQGQAAQPSNAPAQKVASKKLKVTKAQKEKRAAEETQYKESKAAAERKATKAEAQGKWDRAAAETKAAKRAASEKIDRAGKAVAPATATQTPKQ